MKTALLMVGFLVTVSLVIYSCNRQDEGEKLARIHCASCHAFPDPSLLDKATWNYSVLPQMAFRMGLPVEEVASRVNPADLPAMLEVIPDKPMITDQQMIAIRNYYYTHAPDTILPREVAISDSIRQFKIYGASAKIQRVTLIKFDSVSGKTYIGDRSPHLYRLGPSLEIEKSIQVNSPPTSLAFGPDDQMAACLIGLMLPNDQLTGDLILVDKDLTKTTTIASSIRRPVYVEQSDLNLDGKADYVVSAFGHFQGQLRLYTSSGDKLEPNDINPLPGARKTVTRDFNGDGLKDIIVLMTQGDERIILYTNKGNGEFEERILLRFSPVNGSAYFDLADFNRDGHFDILYLNGDNGDFSAIIKPYHEVMLFMNDGSDNFAKVWSFPMPGGQEARAVDFDQDGDLDIAAISYFPDFERHPERSFVYFNNLGGNNFQPQVSKMAATGRWLIMETEDFDGDNDVDILLGSMSVAGLGASEELSRTWTEKGNFIMVLENTLHDKKRTEGANPGGN